MDFSTNQCINETFNGTVCDASFNLTICKQECNSTICETLVNETNCNQRTPPQDTPLRQVLSVLLSVTIAIIMVGMGCGVEVPKLIAHIRKPTGVVVGFLCQFFIMPAIAFGLAKIFQMPDLHTLALLIVGSCPGGSSSNAICYWMNGDLDLSITMTTVSSILGLGMMPLLLWIYSFGFSNALQVPFENIGIALASLIIPIAVGMVIGYKFPRQAPKILKILSVLGLVGLIAVATVSIISYLAVIQLTIPQYICAVLFPIIGMCLGYICSSLVSLYRPLYLQHYQRRTIALETGVQNTQLATAIIQLSGFTFAETGEIILFPVIYLLCQLAWVLILLVPLRLYFCLYKNENTSSSEKSYDDSESDMKMSRDGKYNSAFESSFDESPKITMNKSRL